MCQLSGSRALRGTLVAGVRSNLKQVGRYAGKNGVGLVRQSRRRRLHSSRVLAPFKDSKRRERNGKGKSSHPLSFSPTLLTCCRVSMRSSLLAALALLLGSHMVGAFSVSDRRGIRWLPSARSSRFTAASATSAPCDIPESVGVTGSTLRSLELTNADGAKQKLGEAMGDRCSVVCFLRHLG